MNLFGRYEEVYSTLSMEDFFRAKNLLAAHNISFKDISSNNQLRLSFNNVGGSRIALSRDGSVRNVYRLSVQKKDVEKARRALAQPGR